MSYVLEGWKWGAGTWGTPSGDITWSVDWTNIQYDSGSFDLTAFQDALTASLQAWQNAAAITFSYDADPATAALDFSFTNLTGSTVGEAQTWYVPGASSSVPGVVTAATIRFDSSELWSPDGQTSALSFTSVALHEIGHTLGLDHTTDIHQIMYPYVSGLDTLGNGDIYAAQHIYGLDAGDTAVPDPGADAGTGTTTTGGGGGGGGPGAILAVLAGLLLAVLGGIVGLGAAAATAAMKLGDSHHPDDPSHNADTTTDPVETLAHDTHAIELSDVLPCTGIVGDEHMDANHAAMLDPQDDETHDLIAAL